MFKFCQSKCHNNFKHKCNPRRKRWTKAFRKSHGKELAIDATFEFEKRRNVPVKYSRELWNKTLDAMSRVTKIRERREANFIQKRQVKALLFEREKDKREVDRDIRLIKRVELGERQKKPKKARVVVMKDADEDGEENIDEEMDSDQEIDDSESEQDMQDTDEDELELN